MYYETTAMCYGDGGTFVYMIASFATVAALAPWWMMKGYSIYDKQILVIILNVAWIFWSFYNTILKNYFRQEKRCAVQLVPSNKEYVSSTVASPSYSINVKYGMPSYEVQLAFCFLSFVISFYWLRKGKICLEERNSVWFVWIMFITIWGLWFSGNDYFTHILLAALIGTLLGTSLSLAIYFYWFEYFPHVVNHSLVKKIGFHDTMCLPSVGLEEFIPDGNVSPYFGTGKPEPNTDSNMKRRKQTSSDNTLSISSIFLLFGGSTSKSKRRRPQLKRQTRPSNHSGSGGGKLYLPLGKNINIQNGQNKTTTGYSAEQRNLPGPQHAERTNKDSKSHVRYVKIIKCKQIWHDISGTLDCPV